jgi:hypothetical protein
MSRDWRFNPNFEIRNLPSAPKPALNWLDQTPKIKWPAASSAISITPREVSRMALAKDAGVQTMAVECKLDLSLEEAFEVVRLRLSALRTLGIAAQLHFVVQSRLLPRTVHAFKLKTHTNNARIDINEDENKNQSPKPIG